MRIAKNYDGNWTMSAKLADDRTTIKDVLSWHDKQVLFTSKTATKEKLAVRCLNTEIKEMKQEKVSAKRSFSRYSYFNVLTLYIDYQLLSFGS